MSTIPISIVGDLTSQEMLVIPFVNIVVRYSIVTIVPAVQISNMHDTKKITL